MRDAFQILGIPHDSCERSVIRAFRRLALRLHPDVNRDDPSGETFKDLLHAFEEARAVSRGEPPPRNRWRARSGPQPYRPPPRPRARYVCGRCDDTYPVRDTCPRCDLPLADSWRGECAEAPAEPRVDAMVSALLRRRPPITIERRHVVLASMATIAFGVFEISIGLGPMGVLLIAGGAWACIHALRREDLPSGGAAFA